MGIRRKVLIYYENVKYLMTIKKLLKWQVCWVELLSRLNFVISYTPDIENEKFGLPIHWPNDRLADDQDNK